MRRTGVALVIGGLVLGLVLRLTPAHEVGGDAAMLAISVIPVVMILIGAFLYWRGRQYAARALAQRALSESGPYVLYLRDFRTDASVVRHVFSSLLTPALVSGLVTEEEQLAEAVKPLGNLLAIGKPGETLPTPGASRLYAADNEWQNVISHRMRSARLVVIRAGSSEGLMWEIRRAAELVPPQKLLFLILRMKRDHYRYFRQMVGAILGVSLPPAEHCSRFGRIAGFIAFSPERTPVFLPLKAPFFRRSGYRPYQRTFRFALRPLFEAAGVEWKPPPVSALTVGTAVFAGFVGLGVLWLAGMAMLSTSSSSEPAANVAGVVHLANDDAFTAASERFNARLLALQEVHPELSVPDSERARTIGYNLSRNGMRRLSNGQLIRRAALLARITAEADPQTCAAVFRGDPAPGMETALRRLSAVEIDGWFDLLYDAMSAELQQAPLPDAPSRAEVRRSVQELLDTLSPADAQLLSSMLRNPRAGSDDDACRAARLLYAGVIEVPIESRVTLARALVSP
jgi:hypothetical protein